LIDSPQEAKNSMKAVLVIVRSTFQDIWADLWTMLACNLIWLLANVLVIPGPPATFALVYYADRLAHDEVADLGDFWKAFLSYWGPAWRWGIVNLVVIFFLVMDVSLTGQNIQGGWAPYLQGLYLVLLAVWMILQFFSLPFLFEQEKMSIRQAWRNGMVAISANPGFTLLIISALCLILFTGTILFLLSLMFGAVFAACLSSRSVLNRLELTRLSIPAK